MVPLLDVKNLFVRYGAVQAVKGASLFVAEGEIVTIIGANGAGKSSLLNAIVGLVRPSGGTVAYQGRHIAGWPAYRISALGIGLVPEGKHLFPEMTVLENLQVGAHHRNDNKEIAADMERVFGLFPRLLERRNQLANTLSGGEQQMLAIGRTLMSHVRLLLLDEPSLGLAPVIIKHISEVIGEIQRQEGIGVILVEQNARMALSLAHRAYVLETGEMIIDGAAKDVANSDLVRRAYLGV